MNLEVYHDLVCPFCRIGRESLKRAIASAGLPEAPGVRYRSFLLAPDIPAKGADFREHMERKGGGRIPLEAFFDAPRKLAEPLGIRFNFEEIRVAPNTLLAHRMVNLCPPHIREILIDLLYEAYFERAVDIGDPEALVPIAAEAGWTDPSLPDLLSSDAGRDSVLADMERAIELGVTGVPYILIDGKYEIRGARPPEVLAAGMRNLAGLAT